MEGIGGRVCSGGGEGRTDTHTYTRPQMERERERERKKGLRKYFVRLERRGLARQTMLALLKEHFLSAAQPTDQGEESVVLVVVVVVVVVVGGTIFQSPMCSFLGCEKTKNFVSKGVWKGKNFVQKGVWQGKNFVSKGVWQGKNFVSKGVWQGKNFVSKGVWKGKNFVKNNAADQWKYPFLVSSGKWELVEWRNHSFIRLVFLSFSFYVLLPILLLLFSWNSEGREGSREKG